MGLFEFSPLGACRNQNVIIQEWGGRVDAIPKCSEILDAGHQQFASGNIHLSAEADCFGGSFVGGDKRIDTDVIGVADRGRTTRQCRVSLANPCHGIATCHSEIRGHAVDLVIRIFIDTAENDRHGRHDGDGQSVQPLDSRIHARTVNPIFCPQSLLEACAQHLRCSEHRIVALSRMCIKNHLFVTNVITFLICVCGPPIGRHTIDPANVDVPGCCRRAAIPCIERKCTEPFRMGGKFTCVETVERTVRGDTVRVASSVHSDLSRIQRGIHIRGGSDTIRIGGLPLIQVLDPKVTCIDTMVYRSQVARSGNTGNPVCGGQVTIVLAI